MKFKRIVVSYITVKTAVSHDVSTPAADFWSFEIRLNVGI